MFRATIIAVLALAAPAAAQVTARAPEWARPLLISDQDAVRVRQSALAAPEGGIAARLSIAPAQGGVARLIRFDSSSAGATLTLRRYTGQARNGWVLWGPEEATPVPLDAAKTAQLERLARAALSATLVGGESAELQTAVCNGDYAWVEISEPGRATAVERRCVMSGAAGAIIKALSDAAGSRDEEELYRAGIDEVLNADRAMARAAAEGLGTAMAAYAGDDAIAVPGAAASLRGRDAIGAFFAGAEPYVWSPAGAEVSARGDMAWSFGRWTRGETSGDYVAVWRRDADGAWRYVARTGP